MSETWRQELRRLGWVVNHLRKMSPASLNYLRSLLADPTKWPDEP
jgi:hypothetical protein